MCPKAPGALELECFVGQLSRVTTICQEPETSPCQVLIMFPYIGTCLIHFLPFTIHYGHQHCKQLTTPLRPSRVLAVSTRYYTERTTLKIAHPRTNFQADFLGNGERAVAQTPRDASMDIEEICPKPPFSLGAPL